MVAEGIALGAAVFVSDAVHPLLVTVTVKEAAEATVMQEVVSPVLHKNVLPAAVGAHNCELPQLLVTVIVAERVPGADAFVSDAVHPLLVTVAVKDAVEVTVIQEVVSPVLHK